MQTIELSNVRKSYDQFVAVNNLSFSIEQGGVFGLLGPNGAGKTSTIRMMIGITAPDSGQINMFGKPFERKSLQKQVEELSKGMQQKIQFIAALLHDPDFIIMDDPFFGLDPVNAALLKDV